MVAVAAGSVVAPRPLLRPFLIIGAVCAVIPDIDAVGRVLSLVEVDALGPHRGFTHSVTFAVLLGVVMVSATSGDRRWRGSRVRLWAFVTLATGLHGVLDLFTSIGATTSPVQFFSPFSTRGYALAWHPINGPFSELFLCLLPLMLVTRLVWHLRGFTWPTVRRQAVVLGVGRMERRG